MKRLLIATAVGCCVPLVAFAQTDVAKPHRIQPTDTILLTGTGAKSRSPLKHCSSSGCEITIKVEPYDPNTGECQGTIETLLIFTSTRFLVFRSTTPKIVWKLDTSLATDADYAFDPSTGIDIKETTPTDFGDHGYDGGDNQRYYWNVVADDSYAFTYDINLLRTPKGGGPVKCPFYDPMIVNRD